MRCKFCDRTGHAFSVCYHRPQDTVDSKDSKNPKDTKKTPSKKTPPKKRTKGVTRRIKRIIRTREWILILRSLIQMWIHLKRMTIVPIG